MFQLTQFEFIKKKYGHCASWAVWADEGERPKDNIGDLSVFDKENYEKLLPQLKPYIVLVGLNVSRGLIQLPLANFHDARPEAMDFKIRYALRGSPFWGGYMTDIIKDFDQKASGKVMSYLRANRSFEKANAKRFCEELHDLGVENPTLIAFGRDVHSILTRQFANEYTILRIPHYSNYGSKERYREDVGSVLGFA